jgi:hypothetical protein
MSLTITKYFISGKENLRRNNIQRRKDNFIMRDYVRGKEDEDTI